MNKLLLLVAATILVMAALSPRPVHAFMCCDPYGYYTTSTQTGTGSSCANAQSALAAGLRSEELADCGTLTKLCIGSTVQYTDDCFDVSPGVLGASGYQYYECKSTCVP
ncbi:MAG TPA: hypothetical protein VLX28_04315 [Thermoanaerobaculia bacterium]|nr:hypothetical protein [Thermoanaerobaculia bacterium]